MAVENDAARGIDALQTDAVVQRHAAVFLPLDDLQVDKAQNQDQGRQSDAQHDHDQPLPEPLAVDGFQIFRHGLLAIGSGPLRCFDRLHKRIILRLAPTHGQNTCLKTVPNNDENA